MELTCTLCSKTYSSNKGLLKHKRLIHNEFCIDKERRKNESTNTYSCGFCKKTFSFLQSRWTHEKKCKNEPKLENILVPKEEYETLRTENIKQNEEIMRLKNRLLSGKRLDNKSFRAVNKILKDRSYQRDLQRIDQSNSHNNNTNSLNTINNNITNNNNTYQIFALGNEELTNVLTLRQKKMIMDARLCSIDKIVEIAHCGQLNQFKNIIITNLKDNFAYRYDESKGYFITVSKAYLLDDVINHRMMDIEAIYDELKTANKIDDKTKEVIQRFLDKMQNIDTPFYDNETKYENFKTFKTDNIKILLYNNQDKITKDIALLISGD